VVRSGFLELSSTPGWGNGTVGSFILKNNMKHKPSVSTVNTESVPQLIERAVEAWPDNVAISTDVEALTYRSLHRRTERFAGYLVERGVSRGDAVAICFSRSIEWIIAALGIMRAGAAYIPVDIDWPEVRLRHVLTDSGAKLIVCRDGLISRLNIAVQGIDPFRDAEEINDSRHYAADKSRMDDLAYMIYTSGSSGMPKAVEITHENLSDLVSWHKEAFSINRHDRVSHVTTLSFDAAGWEIWPNLSAGATVCMPKERVRISPESMKEWILNERITVAFVPTSYATPLMTASWPSHTSLRLLLTGGDVLQKAPPAGLPFDVYNNYGPTECTVVATSSRLEPNSGATPPIGRPRKGASIYLLDGDGRLVSDGECGEIYIGGSCVGRGYRNLPELTACHFLPDPFAPEPGHRMFRTGDFGARQADGQIRFVGRIDRQVKLNGKRVELDEVGAALARHPSVEFALVIIENTTEDRKRLVAYFQLKEHIQDVSTKDLSVHLCKILPKFMVPEIFHRVHEVPLSINGKVDVGALSSLSKARALLRTDSDNSTAAVELELLSVIRGLLRDDRIAPRDEFFLAGGDSLFGTALIVSLQSKFGVYLTFDQLFEAGTVERLAVVIAATRRICNRDSALGPRNGTAGDRCKQRNKYPLYWIRPISALMRMIESYHSMVPLTLNPADIERLHTDSSFEAIAERFTQKIIEMDVDGPYCLGGSCRDALLAYEVASQFRKIARPAPILILLDCPGPTSIRLPRPFSPRLRNPGYILKRSAQLGPALTISSICRRIADVRASCPTSSERNRSLETFERTIESSIVKYRPERYEGSALLLLASDHAPHLDLAREWEGMIRTMSVQYFEGHHNDLWKQPQLCEIAAKISAYIRSLDVSEGLSGFC
jgi:amino acid adenylation domain-containing protein